MQKESELMTAEEAANYMKVSVRTIREWVMKGKLSVVRIGKRRYRIRKADLNQYIREHRVRRKAPQQEDELAAQDE